MIRWQTGCGRLGAAEAGLAAKRGVPGPDLCLSPLSLSEPRFVFLFLPSCESLAHFNSLSLSFFVSSPSFLCLSLLYSLKKNGQTCETRDHMPPARTTGWMCEKGAWLSPPGSCSAAWRVPCREEGLGGDGGAEKNQCKPVSFSGPGDWGGRWRAMAGRETREGPDTGSDRGWTQPGQAAAPREEAGCQRPGCPREVSRRGDQTTWSDPAAAAPRETGHFWG